MVRQTNYMFNSLFSRFLSDKSGATAVEYGVLALFIGLAILLAVHAVGDNLALMYASVAEPLSNN